MLDQEIAPAQRRAYYVFEHVLAHDLLSDVMKELLGRTRCGARWRNPYLGNYRVAPPDEEYPRNEHPVVVTHQRREESSVR